ncbi:cardiolipin synthase [Halarsenatibacter silvermanii]|uniref:Cardiolipin synthase n=1 Tax=Halarsenatibacter silvermanii TaxID=321763 RepID=A0A1G9H659_9FIRM|nr:cardiolipin synthase [Halarsenatibacter silvermanii]SDL08431.1 cardiolipin synthase [Halarsenatibacter silvermanii]
MDITSLPLLILGLNLIFIIILIFFERRDPSSTWAWVLILALLPLVGFLVYLFFGLSPRKRRYFQKKQKHDRKKMITPNDRDFFAPEDQSGTRATLEKSIIKLGFNSRVPSLVGKNNIKIYTHGEDKFRDLFQDLRQAEKFIHINYYAINGDWLGEELFDILTHKASEGVEVRLLYDRMGCRNLPDYLLKKLRSAGGRAVKFAPFLVDLNYRDHRKNVIIDGQHGYIGGINVGIEYVGETDRFGDWRDTHLRLSGDSVDSLQHRFLLDWSFACGEELLDEEVYFPSKEEKGEAEVQIVSSGPDSEAQEIKIMFLRMIYGASDSIYIQTPYFIPDESMLEALKVASQTGVDVRIMIPAQPDHPFVYAANNSFVGEMLEAGARCFRYRKGFLHSKMMVIDERIGTVGTANMDVRSFKLNFEINAFIYDQETSAELAEIFRRDLEDSIEITPELYDSRSWNMKFKESLYRLIAPVL